MFLDFFYLLRKVGLQVTLHEWLLLMKALEMGVCKPRLDSFYAVARSLLVKDEAYFDHFDQAFAYYFKDAEEPTLLKKKMLEWLEEARQFDLSPEQLAQLTHLSLEELRELFEERLKEQQERHDGGSRWIGTGGTSPFGHSGVHPHGIRVGGPGGGRSAVQVATARRFKEYRKDRVLDTRQLVVALKKLRILARAGTEEELDLDETIHQTCQNAGEIEIVFRKPRKNNVKLILLMDVGGSMTPYAKLVEKLFSAAHQSNHFKDFQYYYFHNCVYERVYRKASLKEGVLLGDLKKQTNPSYRVIFVGDAYMDTDELLSPNGSIYYYHRHNTPGIDRLKEIADFYRKCVWLNPEREDIWNGTSIEIVGQVFPMFPLTLDGLAEAISTLIR